MLGCLVLHMSNVSAPLLGIGDLDHRHLLQELLNSDVEALVG